MSGFTLDTKMSRVPVDPENVYLDIMTTNVLGNRTEPLPIQFNENRTNAILDNAGDYCMSVVRFSLDTQTLPVFIPVINTAGDDPNETVYYVSMEWNGITYNQAIEWIPQNQYLSPPPLGQYPTEQSMNQPYYYAYDYQWIAYLVQNALVACMNSLKKTYDGSPTEPGEPTPIAVDPEIQDITPPTFVYDPTSQSFIISANKKYFEFLSPTGSNNPIKLFFNSQLFELFSSFPALNYGMTDQYKHYQIIFNSSNGANEISVPTVPEDDEIPQTFIQVIQETPTLANLTPVSAIVFTSSMLPILPEQISSPQIFIEGAHASTGNNANIGQIITDLESDDGTYKPSIQYTPTAEYRRISLLSSRPLTHIQLSVYWRNRYGDLIPVTLAGGASMTCKILFQKRSSIYNDA